MLGLYRFVRSCIPVAICYPLAATLLFIMVLGPFYGYNDVCNTTSFLITSVGVDGVGWGKVERGGMGFVDKYSCTCISI